MTFKICTKCGETKELSLFYSKRYWCKSCCKEANKDYYSNNKETIKKATKEWAANNRCMVNGYKTKYRVNNRDKVLQSSEKYRLNNKDKIKEYYLLNKLKYLLKARQREIAKLKRTPSWLTDQDYKYINYLYAFSKNISNYLGQKYHVDHIVPLQGKLVSGLHVPSNLQVIPATINLQKGNKYGI